MRSLLTTLIGAVAVGALAVWPPLPGWLPHSTSPSEILSSGRDEGQLAPVGAALPHQPDPGPALPLAKYHHVTIEAPQLPPDVVGNLRGLGVAPDGSLLVADSGPDRIVRFDTDGSVAGQWGGYGTRDGAFLGIDRMVVGLDGSVWVYDASLGWPESSIQRFDHHGRFLDRRSGPMPTAVEADGDVWRGRMRYDADGNLEAALPPGSLGRDGLVLAANGTVFAHDGDGGIGHFDEDGRTITAWQLPPFDTDDGVAVGRDPFADGIWVSHWTTQVNRLTRFDPTGTEVIGLQTDPFLTHVAGLHDGSVAAGQREIRRFTEAGAAQTIARSASAPKMAVYDMAADGHILVGPSDFGREARRLFVLDRLGAVMSQVELPSDVHLDFNAHIALASDGSIWLADDGRLRHFDVVGNPLSDTPGFVTAMDVLADGRAVVAAGRSMAVLHRTGDSETTWEVGSHGDAIDDVAVGTDGHIWAILSGSDGMSIERFTATGNHLASLPIGTSLAQRYRGDFGATLAVGPGPVLYISVAGERTRPSPRSDVFAFDERGHLLATYRLPTYARFEVHTELIATDSTGRLLVADPEGRQLTVLTTAVDPSWRLLAWPTEHREDLALHSQSLPGEELLVSWGAGAPAGLPADGFMLRAAGDLRGPGLKRLTIRADGGVRLWLGAQLILDDWLANGVVWSRDVVIPARGMTAVIEYVDRGGDAALELDVETLADLHTIHLPATYRAVLDVSAGGN